MIKLKNNALIHSNLDEHKAILYDTYSAKKYYIPFNIAVEAQNNNLSSTDVLRINNLLVDDAIPVVSEVQEKRIQHLRLIVTNKCNFKCSYCFAEGGSYGMYLDSMDEITAEKVIDFFFDKFSYINQVSFFGGEPLLEINIISCVCEYIHSLYENKKILILPKFSMVTNGYLLDEKVVEIINKYHISLVVSHDGPPDIHNSLRKARSNKGTFSHIDKCMLEFRRKNRVSIESTYTSIHEQNSISRDQLSEYLSNRYSTDRVEINDVQIEDEKLSYLRPISKITMSEKMHNFFLGEEKLYNDFLIRLLTTYLSGKYSKEFCSSGVREYCVDMHGDIYPCHRFEGKPEYKLGNVYNNEPIRRPKIKTKDDLKCSVCKYKMFCQVCVYSLSLDEEYCNDLKSCIDYFLHNMLDLLITNKEEYNRIIEGYVEYGRKNRI